jgi:hypothetical protein
MQIARWLSINVCKRYDVNLIKYFDKNILSMYEGNFLYHDLKELVNRDITIFVDFDGVVFDQSFIQFAFGKLLEFITIDELKSKVIFLNLTKSNERLVGEYLNKTERYWKDSKYRETLIENLYNMYDP